MSDAPPPLDANNEPTRSGDMTPPMSQGQSPNELPRRGYDSSGRRMSPPPPPPSQPQQPTPPLGNVQPPPSQPPSYAAPPRTGGPRPPRRRSTPQTRAESGMYLPWWSLVILVATVGIGACGLLFIVGQSNWADGLINIGDQTPAVIIVTQENFSSNNNNINNNSDAPPGSVPTAIPIAPTQPQSFATATTRPRTASGCPLGVLIAVSGTGEVGLAVRTEPIQGNNITYVAAEGEQFRIIGGPETSIASDGSEIEWCHLQGALATSVDGWGSIDFLTVIDE